MSVVRNCCSKVVDVTSKAVWGENTRTSGKCAAAAGAVAILAGLFFAGLTIASLIPGANLKGFGAVGKCVTQNPLAVGLASGGTVILGLALNLYARNKKEHVITSHYVDGWDALSFPSD